MTIEKVKKVLTIISSTFPSFRVTDPEITVTVWYDVLTEYSDEVIMAALKAYIKTDTTGFAPTPGQLIDLIDRVGHINTDLSEGEAWSLVYRALCNSTYNAAEEFGKLPAAVQKAVGSPAQLRAWAGDSEFNEGVASSTFKRAYRTVLERDRMDAKLGGQLMQLIEGITSGAFIEGGKK